MNSDNGQVETGELEAMLTDLRVMKMEIAPLVDEIKRLEQQIRQHVLETGEVAEVDGVKLSIRNGYTRYSWDSKALTGFAAAHPEILVFRSEREIAPTVAIKVVI